MTNLNRRSALRRAGLALLGTGAASGLEPQAAAQHTAKRPAASTPAGEDCNCLLATDGSPLDTGASEIRPVIERYEVELRDLNRVYPLEGSTVRQGKLEKFYADQLQLLERIHFDAMSQAGKVDYLLLRSRLEREQRQLLAAGQRDAEIQSLIPFQQTIIGFEEARRRMETVDGQKSAVALEGLVRDVAVAKDSMSGVKKNPVVLNGAAQRLEQLRTTMRGWYDFYALYDPKFVWWVEAGYKKADDTVEAHAQFLHTASGIGGTLEAGGGFGGGRGGGGRGGGGGGRGGAGGGGGRNAARSTAPLGSDEELSGVGPAGNDALVDALQAAMIAYTPDELITLANREFAWCDKELLRASGEMGFGADWKKAQEAVKNKYVEPGQMIYLVRDLAREAIEFVEKHELVTLPPLLKEDYWEEAMTPQGQLTAPFFLGGAVIQVSSPASSQTIEAAPGSLTRQQYLLRPRHRIPRTHSRAPHAGLHDAALSNLSKPVQHAVLDRGNGVLLGDAAVGFGVHAYAGTAHRGAVLENAPLRAHHFLAELPPGKDEGDRVRAIPDRPRGIRTRQCGRRSAALVQRILSADLPMRLYAGRDGILRLAQGTCRLRENDQSRVSRCDVSGRQHARGDGKAGSERPEGDARLSKPVGNSTGR